MKLNRTAGYAVHVMAYVAEQDNGRPIVGHAAATRLGLSQGFLLRLLVALSRAGLLRSIKGPNGGYNLAKPAKSITLLDIVEAVEGPIISRVDPTANPPDTLDDKLEAVATAATDRLRKELDRVRLAELVASSKKAR